MERSEILDKLNVRRRRRILGLPIGPKRTDWSQMAKLGAKAAGVTAAVVGGKKVLSSENGSSGDDES